MTKENGYSYLMSVAVVALIVVIPFTPKIAEIITSPHATSALIMPASTSTAQFRQPYQITAVQNGQKVKFVSLRAANGETADLTFLITDQIGCELRSGRTMLFSPNEIEHHYSDLWIGVCSPDGMVARSTSEKKVVRVHVDPLTGIPLSYQ